MDGSVKKITSYLFLLRIVRMLLSIIALPLSAKYFGISLERDIWILVFTFMSVLLAAVWGPLNETFRAKFVFIREEEGEENAIIKTNSLINFILLITSIISVLLILLSRNIASAMTGLLSENSIPIFIYILLALIPTLFINQITSILISILNAYNIYFIPEIAGVISGIFNLIIIIVLAPVIGIYSLVISQYIGIVLLLLFVLFYIRRKNICIWKRKFYINFSHVKIFIFFSLPFFFPYFFGQCNLLAEKWLAGMLGSGVISSLDYARQFTMVFQSVLSSVLTTVMVPMLAKSYSISDKTQCLYILKENMFVCFVIICLVIPLLIGAADPICQFFFSHGNISSDGILNIITLMRLYSIAFIGAFLYLFFGLALLSSKKGKLYAFWGVVTQILILILNFTLMPRVGIFIFPISFGLCHFFTAMVLLHFIDKEYKKCMYIYITKAVLWMSFLSVLLFFFNKLIVLNSSFGQLSINVLLVFLLFCLIARRMGFSVIAYLKNIIKK